MMVRRPHAKNGLMIIHLALLFSFAPLLATQIVHAAQNSNVNPGPTPSTQEAPRPKKGVGFSSGQTTTLYQIGFGYLIMPYPGSAPKPSYMKTIPISADLAVLRSFFDSDTALGISTNYGMSYDYYYPTASQPQLTFTAQRLFLGLSFRQALGTNLFSGFNLRMDAGFAKYVSSEKIVLPGSTTLPAGFSVQGNKNSTGVGGLLGLSYAFRLKSLEKIIGNDPDRYAIELFYHLSYMRLSRLIEMGSYLPACHSFGFTFVF